MHDPQESFWLGYMKVIPAIHGALALLITVLPGCKSSKRAEIDFADGSYSGALDKDGKKHGKGIYRWNDGSVYEGDYRNDQRHGMGRFMWANGESYTGEYRHDERTGKGLYLWPDGSRYEGDFLAGLRHGRGIFTSANGIIYEGEWFDDSQHGVGTLTYPDGRVVKGIWRNGKLVSQRAPLPASSSKPDLSSTPSPKETVETATLNLKNTKAIKTKGLESASTSAVNRNSQDASQPASEPKDQDLQTSASFEKNTLEAPAPTPTSAKQPLPEPTPSIRSDTQADWTGTVEEAESQFTTDLIDGIDTVRVKETGKFFSGRMRIISPNGVAQGEVELVDGRLNGEEIFFNSRGDVVERNTWRDGVPVDTKN